MSILDIFKSKKPVAVEPAPTKKQSEVVEEVEEESDEPLVSIVGERIDPELGIVLTLKWNDAFIKYLRENGFHATSEEGIVQQWLGGLYGDMQQRLQRKSNIMSDFE